MATDQLCPPMTINKLPDEDLLEIFGFYMTYRLPPPSYEEDAWHTLVHVCRRWRYVVFGSPRLLDLRLLCINGRLMKTLDIWQELPIAVRVDDNWKSPSVTDSDVVSMLKRHDQVCEIIIDSVPFPTIGKLLLSTHNLVDLSLSAIPPSGYISPEAMVAILSPLTMLKSLHLEFEIPKFRTLGASRRPSALGRVVLPALTCFGYYGKSKYLEDMVSRFDAPLERISVTFSKPPVVSDVSMLRDFIGRTKIPNAVHRADTSFSDNDATISLFQRKGGVDVEVVCLEIPGSIYMVTQPSSLARACNSLLPPLPSLEQLGIYRYKPECWPSKWELEVEDTHWTKLLRPFITVKDLVLDELVVLSVASALEALVGGPGRVTEILPALQNIFLEGFQSSRPVPKDIAKFIAARKLSGCPVTVHHRETE